MEQRGKLIVIEGVDGSGKTTQFNLLLERLQRDHGRVETIHFPQHGNPFFGVMVDEYLNGKFGDASTVNPHLASVLYACDRWEAKPTLDAWIAEGATVLLDRYMTSNKGHQLGKIKTEHERIEYLTWLDAMEYETFKVPRPDKVIYLRVPISFALSHLSNRDTEGKEYSNGERDQHENEYHLKGACSAYDFVVDRYDYWSAIDCAPDGEMRTIEDIHEEVYTMVKEIL